jgi:hypothetical protein
MQGAVNLETSGNELLDSCRRQLIEQGDLFWEDELYTLTPQGRAKVEKELQRRYGLRPAMMVMIEQFVLEQHDIAVY